eukprot:jgi/Chrpa1/22888/Chrysochromulina_OHIO_Genome00023449-RA
MTLGGLMEPERARRLVLRSRSRARAVDFARPMRRLASSRAASSAWFMSARFRDMAAAECDGCDGWCDGFGSIVGAGTRGDEIIVAIGARRCALGMVGEKPPRPPPRPRPRPLPPIPPPTPPPLMPSGSRRGEIRSCRATGGTAPGGGNPPGPPDRPPPPNGPPWPPKGFGREGGGSPPPGSKSPPRIPGTMPPPYGMPPRNMPSPLPGHGPIGMPPGGKRAAAATSRAARRERSCMSHYRHYS